MSKDISYYPQDCDIIHNQATIALLTSFGVEGFGRYILLKIFLRKQEGYRYDISKKFSFSSLAEVLRCNLQECQRFINALIDEFELCKYDGSFLFCPELSDAMRPLDEKRKVLSERGRKGAEVVNNRKKSPVSETGEPAQAIENTGTSETEEQQVKKSKVKKSKEEESSVEATTHPTTPHTSLNESEEEFKTFARWVEGTAPDVAKMKYPFTKRQFYLLKAEYPDKCIKKIITDMGNKADLNEKYNSAFFTFKSFAKNEKDESFHYMKRAKSSFFKEQKGEQISTEVLDKKEMIL